MPINYKTLFWRSMTVLTTLLVMLMALLLMQGCQNKQPAAPAEVIIYADTTRTRLVHRVDSSRAALTIVSKNSRLTLSAYEKAANTYDSLPLPALP